MMELLESSRCSWFQRMWDRLWMFARAWNNSWGSNLSARSEKSLIELTSKSSLSWSSSSRLLLLLAILRLVFSILPAVWCTSQQNQDYLIDIWWLASSRKIPFSWIAISVALQIFTRSVNNFPLLRSCYEKIWLTASYNCVAWHVFRVAWLWDMRHFCCVNSSPLVITGYRLTTWSGSLLQSTP